MSETQEDTMKRMAEEFKKANRERQKKYYDANKEKMADKAKKRWADTKAVMAEHKKKEGVKPAEKIAVKPAEDVAVKPTVKPKAKGAPRKKLVFMTMDMELLLSQILKPNMPESSVKIYSESAKRLLKVLGKTDKDNLVPIFKDTDEISKKIEESEYAHNVKKMLFQFILFALDNSQIKKTKDMHKAYKLKYSIYAEDSKAIAKEKKDTEDLITFSDYLKKVRERFGENSKMDIIARLYHEFTPRDDFVLKIVPSIKFENYKDTNYIIVGGKISSKSRHYRIVINTFKTDGKYEPYNYDVSSELSNDIKKYMETNGLTYSDYLFGKKKLTKYVSENNKRIGVSGGINIFRHMSVAELLSKEDLTTEQWVKKAEAMMHSVATQATY